MGFRYPPPYGGPSRRPKFRGPFQPRARSMQRLFWHGGMGVAAPTVLTNNAVNVQLMQAVYTVPGAAVDPGELGSDDYVIKRIVGMLKLTVSQGSNSGQFFFVRCGIALLDTDQNGTAASAAADPSIDPHLLSAVSARRWLHIRRWAGPIDTTGANTFYDSDKVGPHYSTLDLTPNVRCKQTQRAALVFYPELFGGATDALIKVNYEARILIGKSR
jgi:hypothetical protein